MGQPSRHLGTRRSDNPLAQFLIGFASFCTLVGSIVFLWKENSILTALVLLEALALLSLWHKDYDMAFFLTATVLGSVAEVTFVYFGVWIYSNPTVLGIPLWFPLAFGTSALIAGRLVNTIVKVLKSRVSKRAREWLASISLRPVNSS